MAMLELNDGRTASVGSGVKVGSVRTSLADEDARGTCGEFWWAGEAF